MDTEKLFQIVEKVIQIGEFRMGFRRARIVDGVLYWTLDTNEMIAIDPVNKRVFLANAANEFAGEVSDELETELSIICLSLESAIEVAETGVFGVFPRLRRILISRFYEATNRYRKIKQYMGFPLDEISYYRKYSLMAAATRVIELGSEKVGLVSSKVHNGKLYLFQGDKGYIVIDPQDLTGKGHFLYRADSLEDQDLVILTTSHGNEKIMTDQLRSWLKDSGN